MTQAKSGAVEEVKPACTCWRNRYECPRHELVGWLDDKRTPYFSQPIMRDRQQPKAKQ